MDSTCLITMLQEIGEQAHKLIDRNTQTPQSLYVIEEMSELSKELVKDARNKGNKENIEGEISDVFASLFCYMCANNINPNTILSQMKYKIDRAVSRSERAEF